MGIVQSNGDINVLLVTIICVGFIILCFVLVSLFNRMRKKEEEELESYYDDYNEVEEIPKKKVVRIKRTSKPNTIKNKAKNNPIPKRKKKVAVKKKEEEKKTLIEDEKIKNKKSPIENKKTAVKKLPQKSVPEKKEEKKIESKPVESKVVEKPKKEKVEKKKIESPVIEPEVIVKRNKDKQREIKIVKVGSVQVRNTIRLNDSEKALIKSVMTSPNRGHIFQVFTGTKIMDFTIDNPTQLNHIEKQIKRFSDPKGKYVVYIVWESDLKHRVTLTQKLKYNPAVRY